MEEISLEDFEKAKQTIAQYQNQDFKKIYGDGFSCICCDKKITAIHPEHMQFPQGGMYNGGVVDKISAGYGSKHDTDMFIVAICDDCITALKEKKKIMFAGNYMNLY